LKIKNFIFNSKKNVLYKNNKKFILTRDKIKFLKLFFQKEIATLEEIKHTINKEGNALYVFLSKLKKKTGIKLKNIKGLRYQIE
jgi:hypothetical protein